MLLSCNLIIIIIMPLTLTFIQAMIPPLHFKLLKQMALGSSILLFILFFLYYFKFNSFFIPFQLINSFSINFFFFNYIFGIDVLNFLFISLTLFIMPFCILVSWNSFFFRVKWFYMYLFLIEFLLTALFATGDLVAFYLCFESLLIPLFLLIIGWGSRQRKLHASLMFFFYTLIGSLFMLLGLLYIYSHYGSTNIYILNFITISNYRQLLLWLSFFISFGTKIPMIPFHIWLPEAHVEAPTACSVLLAGILLKLGTYGFLRFSLLLFPYASFFFSPIIFLLAICAIIYCSFVTLRQIDIKKIIAYSSIIHMNFGLLGLFSFNFQALSGCIFVMLSHGIISAGLFLCVGFLYDRYNSRLLYYYNGLIYYMPIYASVFFFFFLGNMGFPGTCGFVGEFLIIIGLIQINPFVICLGGLSLIFSGIYSIWLYNRLFFSYLKFPFIFFSDLNLREIAISLPLVFLVFFLGLYPNFILHFYDIFLYSYLFFFYPIFF